MSRPEPTLGNPKNTIEILQKYKFVFQKKFGQNFLIDEHVLEKIIQAAGVGSDDFVVEIGPGIGTMTQYLAHAARGVAAVEIDRALIPILKDTLSPYDNVSASLRPIQNVVRRPPDHPAGLYRTFDARSISCGPRGPREIKGQSAAASFFRANSSMRRAFRTRSEGVLGR